MSASYAERLSEYPNKGVCGLPESYDTPRSFTSKLDALTKLVKRSRHTVVLTGAGISTGAGIPDFRGPSGIWTKEQERKKREKRALSKKKSSNNSTSSAAGSNGDKSAAGSLKRMRSEMGKANTKADDVTNATTSTSTPLSVSPGTVAASSTTAPSSTTEKQVFTSFASAIPTYTHRALTHLILQSPPPSLPSSNEGTLTSSNNNKFLHHIGKLKDTLLDWEDALPDVDWTRAQEECEKADLIVCLGTSLRIEPAGSLCTFANPTKEGGGSGGGGGRSSKLGYAIVNLQQTPYDDGAALVIRAKVDDVMRGLMARLGYEDDWDDKFDYGKGAAVADNDDSDEEKKPASKKNGPVQSMSTSRLNLLPSLTNVDKGSRHEYRVVDMTDPNK
eukprot:scaffold13320_cov215-Alexandrium_tamarense.AAC.27